MNNIDRRLSSGVSMWLHGPYGSGKSSIAAILLKAAFKAGQVGYFIKANDITGHLITRDPYDARSTVYEHLQEVPLLVIDEFQMRPNMAQLESTVEDMIRARVGEKKSTVVTTNHSLDDLEKRFPALSNVIKETFICLKVAGKDFRANG